MTVLPVVIGSLYRLLVPRSVTWQKFYWGCSCRKEFVRVQESQTGPAYSRTGCTRVKYRRATNVLPKLQGIGPLVDASKCKPYKIHDVGVCHDVESRLVKNIEDYSTSLPVYFQEQVPWNHWSWFSPAESKVVFLRCFLKTLCSYCSVKYS